MCPTVADPVQIGSGLTNKQIDQSSSHLTRPLAPFSRVLLPHDEQRHAPAEFVRHGCDAVRYRPLGSVHNDAELVDARR